MTMTETPAEAPKPKKAKPKRKARKVAAKPAETKETVAYPGMTKTECPADCGINGCVISGKPYCGHPRKGGLQQSDLGNAAAIGRLQSAKKQLALEDAEKRFT